MVSLLTEENLLGNHYCLPLTRKVRHHYLKQIFALGRTGLIREIVGPTIIFTYLHLRPKESFELLHVRVKTGLWKLNLLGSQSERSYERVRLAQLGSLEAESSNSKNPLPLVRVLTLHLHHCCTLLDFGCLVTPIVKSARCARVHVK